MDEIARQLIVRLRDDPHDADAYAALKQHYQYVGDLDALAGLLEGWAGTEGRDAGDASQAYAEAADAALRGSGDRARAKDLFRRALQCDVTRPEPAERLQELLENASEVQQLAEFLDAYARALEESGSDPERAARAYERLGHLWAQQFGREDVAQPYLQRAAELRGWSAGGEGDAPGSDDAAPPLDEDAATLAAQYEQEAEAETNEERKLDLLSQLASLRVERLGDLEGAILALRKALAIAPGDIQIMHQLATCLLARAEQSEEAQAAADYRRVGELFYRIAQGVETAQAIDYLESALESVPGHEGALAMLEQLAPDQGREDLLAPRWVAFLSAVPDGPEADQRRVLLGRAYIEAEQFDDAIASLGPAAERGEREAHQLLQEIYARQAQPRDEANAAPPGKTAEGEPVRLPTTRPPKARAEHEIATETLRVTTLRRAVQNAISGRRTDDAVELCRQILGVDPNDPEAFNLLENHYRKTRDYDRLRDLLLASTRVPGLSVDARRLRLKEIAKLCETRLRDAAGAVSAWQSMVALDPADHEASQSLRRLLQKSEQWDDLAGVLERAALATTNRAEQKQVLQELVRVQRDKRKDGTDTADALQQLLALDPSDAAVRDELCDLLLALERWEEAAPLLRERIDASAQDRDKQQWLAVLAAVLHDRIGDIEAAFTECERILRIKPDDADAFARMERIDEAQGNWTRVLQTLERRIERATQAEKAALFVRMGTIAEQKLYDLGKAADFLGEALNLRPDDPEMLQQLVGMFERAGRYADLVELLRERAMLEQEAKSRAALHRRMAQVLVEHLEQPEAATKAYERLLEIEEDEAALRHVRAVVAAADDPARLAELLARLATVVTNADEKRDLLLERAELLHGRLGESADAVRTLVRIIEDIDPRSLPAVERMLEICKALGDRRGYARALGLRLELETGTEARLVLARELADVAEREIDDAAAAIGALQRWGADDPRDPEPHRRLRRLLEAQSDWIGVLAALDALAALEPDFAARDDARFRAARLTFEPIGNIDAAWQRLEPLVQEGHAAAEDTLRQVAKHAKREHQLAALYMRFAQEAEDANAQGRYWREAMGVFERSLQQPSQALEASLRMLATSLANRDFLSDVDRLAATCGAWPRLAQVYDRLLKDARDDADKVALLRRHAVLLQATHPAEALDRVLRACALDLQDIGLLEHAEELARISNRSEKMLVVYDRRCAKVDDDASKVDLLLRAARMSDGALRDRDRAQGYLKAALGVAAASPELALRVENTARQLDEANPELDSARRALVRAHVELAEHAAAEVAGRLVLRAAELSASDLKDERGAFEILRRGSGLLPANEVIYERLLGMATRAKRLDALDAHLSRLIHDVIDSATTVILLERRGRLLEGALNRHQDAAMVYTKLLQLRPDDEIAADRLRKNLRRSARHQELLLVIEKQLKRALGPEAKLALLKEMATTWERYLRNRWEATDAWKKVLELAPDDADASAALARLAAGEMAAPEPEPTAEVPAVDALLATRDDIADVALAAADAEPAGVEAERVQAEHAQTPPESTTEDDAVATVEADADASGLASLSAGIAASGGSVAEFDLLNEDAIEVTMDTHATRRGERPALPPLSGRASSAPPPLPSRVSSTPPPVPAGTRASVAPPLPRGSSAPPLPAAQTSASRSSVPPPLPQRSSAPPVPVRQVSQPPPLPVRVSGTPPTPAEKSDSDPAV